MLLRSSSSPLLNSWIAHQSPEHHHHHHHHHPQQHPAVDHHHHHHHHHQQAVFSLPHAPPPRPTRGKRMTTAMLPRTLSDSDLSHPSPPIRKQNSLPPPYDYAEKEDTNIINKKTEEETPPSPSPSPSPSPARLLSSSGLDRYAPVSAVHSATLVDNEECAEGGGGDGRGRGTGKKCGWGDKRGSSDPENIAATDSYYRKMIQVDPGNSLLLGNYAKFLKEVRGDATRARDYMERAILENPSDGLLLSLYADLVWQTTKDAQRAESYFDRAIQAAPHDSHVLASYAYFLWDAEEDEDEDQGNEDAVERNHFPVPAIQRAAATAS